MAVVVLLVLLLLLLDMVVAVEESKLSKDGRCRMYGGKQSLLGVFIWM